MQAGHPLCLGQCHVSDKGRGGRVLKSFGPEVIKWNALPTHCQTAFLILTEACLKRRYGQVTPWCFGDAERVLCRLHDSLGSNGHCSQSNFSVLSCITSCVVVGQRENWSGTEPPPSPSKRFSPTLGSTNLLLFSQSLYVWLRRVQNGNKMAGCRHF